MNTVNTVRLRIGFVLGIVERCRDGMAAIRQKSLRLVAVSTEGPVVVSVDAGHWTLYDGGVARWRFSAPQSHQALQ